jgi:prepilin-type N-terminal cleavage/methylation domain-containing protein
MKTVKEQLPMVGDRWPMASPDVPASAAALGNRKSPIKKNRAGFTLIELLAVISIIGVLAGLTLVVLKPAARLKYIKTAQAELSQIELALDNYKAQYGVYPPGNTNSTLLPQLYYELSGTTYNGSYFVTLDGSSSITNVLAAYGVGGFINCTRGSDEDSVKAKNFIPGFKANPQNQNHVQIYYSVTNNGISTTILGTSVGGPDQNYQPFGVSDINPFRYRYPGVNNPNSYDLWVQLVISGKTNLICNWSKQVQINSPLP